jgi:hypothetical protein
MKEVGGVMFCAHLSPSVPGHADNTNSAALGPRVMATASFNNAGAGVMHVYARNMGTGNLAGGYNIGDGGGSDNYMSIVGVPGGTSYNIYSQVTRANRIAERRRIFP